MTSKINLLSLIPFKTDKLQINFKYLLTRKHHFLVFA